MIDFCKIHNWVPFREIDSGSDGGQRQKSRHGVGLHNGKVKLCNFIMKVKIFVTNVKNVVLCLNEVCF
jgi:hypothetical protein